MENKIEAKAIRKCIETFFSDLNDQYNVTVSSVSIKWEDYCIMGHHDKFILADLDIRLRV